MNEGQRIEQLNNLKTVAEERMATELARYDTHTEVLRALEQDFGFDLDVASDIYGDLLLDPLQAEPIIEQWTSLLQSLQDKPDLPLVVYRQAQIKNPMPLMPEPGFRATDTSVEAALIPKASIERIVYSPETANHPASIYIKADDITWSNPPGQKKPDAGIISTDRTYADIILARPISDSELPPVYGPHDRYGIGEPGFSFVHDPRPEQISALYDSVSPAYGSPLRLLGAFRKAMVDSGRW